MSGTCLMRMAGRSVVLLLILTISVSAVEAQPRESSDPIGGVTFDPPRRATIRHKSNQVIRGDLIGVSEELVHFRVTTGKQFHYPLKDIRSIATTDSEFKYNSAYDTFRELVERARGLTGVTVDMAAAVAGTGQAIEFPRPPVPALPRVVDPPENYAVLEAERLAQAAEEARHVPAIPQNQATAVPAAVVGPAQPFYETSAFKIGFLISSLAVVLFWWRNKVG